MPMKTISWPLAPTPESKDHVCIGVQCDLLRRA